MKKNIEKIILKMLDIRSLMAFILTVTFAILAIKEIVSPAEFLTIFTAVILYFFVDTSGNEKNKKNDSEKKERDENE